MQLMRSVKTAWHLLKRKKLLAIDTEAKDWKSLSQADEFPGVYVQLPSVTELAWLNRNEDGLSWEGPHPKRPEKMQGSFLWSLG